MRHRPRVHASVLGQASRCQLPCMVNDPKAFAVRTAWSLSTDRQTHSLHAGTRSKSSEQPSILQATCQGTHWYDNTCPHNALLYDVPITQPLTGAGNGRSKAAAGWEEATMPSFNLMTTCALCTCVVIWCWQALAASCVVSVLSSTSVLIRSLTMVLTTLRVLP